TFVSAGGMKYPLDVGDVLQIPRGEVHDVEVGPDGVDYQMWVPVAVPEEKWETKLTDEGMDLIRTNLAVPEHEDGGGRPVLRRHAVRPVDVLRGGRDRP